MHLVVVLLSLIAQLLCTQLAGPDPRAQTSSTKRVQPPAGLVAGCNTSTGTLVAVTLLAVTLSLGALHSNAHSA